MLTGERWREGGDLRAVATRLGLVGAWVFALLFAALSWAKQAVGMDSHAYWLAGHHAHPYIAPPGWGDAYLYSPLFQQVTRPLTWLPWPAFAALFLVLPAVGYWWLTGPLPWRWRVPVLLFASAEVMVGNIHSLLAVAVVLSVRYPEAWGVPLLTKVTPAVGGLWHVGRGDWRAIRRGALIVGSVTAVSVALDPGMWVEWLRFLTTQGSGEWFVLVRTVAGACLAVYAGRTNRPWLLGVAAWLALGRKPFDPHSLAMLTCLVRLSSTSRRSAVRRPAETEVSGSVESTSSVLARPRAGTAGTVG